ncbi:hypothetical protein Taro_006574 [Colocasia esculenta]|uniref:Uncharacterized protein n=1 Tax=Colocasia esculenta TaxID=4460 RepID=A0A843TXR3_COLES|nr:hypothetical protein [Colocasia esculenta]
MDLVRWDKKGIVTVKSAYAMISNGGVRHGFHKQVWKPKSLLQPKFPAQMRTIMASTPHNLSFSKCHFRWIIKNVGVGWKQRDWDRVVGETTMGSSLHHHLLLQRQRGVQSHCPDPHTAMSLKKKHLGTVPSQGSRLHSCRQWVHFAFQVDLKSSLIREMASRLVRIALECENMPQGVTTEPGVKWWLLEEPLRRTYCNRKKCEYTAMEPMSIGAGVLLGVAATEEGEGEDDGDMMYMRVRFGVVGLRDPEAFYMINPDSNGGPKLSIHMLRV